MAFIEWKECYNIGVEVIDKQHYSLAETINALYDVSSDPKKEKAIERAFYTLISYTKFHFKAEEDILEDNAYPKLEEHKYEHLMLQEEVFERQKEFALYGNEIYPELIAFLKRWFMGHTQGVDREFVEHLRSMQALDKQKVSKSVIDERLKTLQVVPLIPWKAEYNLGVPDIDIQHRQLADSLNLAYNSFLNPGHGMIVDEIFKQIEDYTRYHFATEEIKQAKAGFPDCEWHINEHRRFIRQVADLKFKYSKFKTVVDYDLLLLLRDWFMNHTQVEDRKYLPYFKGKD